MVSGSGEGRGYLAMSVLLSVLSSVLFSILLSVSVAVLLLVWAIPEVVRLLEVVVILGSEGFFLLDCLFVLWLNVAAFSSFALSSVSIGGVQEGSRAQREILRTAEVSNFLSVKVSAHSTGDIAVVFISVDDDLFGIKEGNIDGWGLDLDSSAWHVMDLCNVVVALFALVFLNDGVRKLNFLTVDKDNEVSGLLSLEKSLNSTSSWLWLSNDDLGARENNLELDILSSEVLG